MKSTTIATKNNIIIPAINDSIDDKYAFLDCDILITCLNIPEVFDSLLELSLVRNLSYIIDPFVKFEFLRNKFLTSDIEKRKCFLDEAIFYPAGNNTEILNKVTTNALNLSRIYAHIGCKGASFVDLHLAGRSMLYSKSSLIVTSNKKDFPSNVFDVKAGLSYLNQDCQNETIRSISFLSFNKEKFEQEIYSLEKLNTLHSSSNSIL